MLSAFSRIQLTSGPITVNPLILPELKVVELSDEDLLKHFYSFESEYGDGICVTEHNDYYCKAVLKLSTTVTATFESDSNYVLNRPIIVLALILYRYT